MTDPKLARLGIFLGILIAVIGIISGISSVDSVVARFVFRPTPSLGTLPPEITGFTLIPPGPMFPGARTGIQVNVKSNDHRIDTYWWVVRAGEGTIVGGQGTPLVTYEAPKTPGTYKVRVELEYEGGPPVEASTEVEVVPEPTPTSTDTPTPTPTNTPTSISTPTPTPTGTPIPKPDAVVKAEALNLRSGPDVVYDILGVLKRGDCLKVIGRDLAGDWLKVIAPDGQEGWTARSLLQVNVDMDNVPVGQVPPTPTPMPTPTATPTPALLPPPILTWPENGAAFIGEPVLLKWQWVRPLAPDEIFSVRVYKEGATELCHHSQVQGFEYFGDLIYCSAGKHYWGVAVSRQLCRDCPEEEMWQKVSEPSAERWIYYTPPGKPGAPPPDLGPPEPPEPPGPPEPPPRP